MTTRMATNYPTPSSTSSSNTINLFNEKATQLNAYLKICSNLHTKLSNSNYKPPENGSSMELAKGMTNTSIFHLSLSIENKDTPVTDSTVQKTMDYHSNSGPNLQYLLLQGIAKKSMILI